IQHLEPVAAVFGCEQRDSAQNHVIPSVSRGIRRGSLKIAAQDPSASPGTTLMLIQHGGSKFEGFITLSPEHARNLFAPRFAAYFTQLSKGATASYFFHHHELRCRRRRHGRQMGNAKHLMALG